MSSNPTKDNESELSTNLSTPFNNQEVNTIEKDTALILNEERAVLKVDRLEATKGINNEENEEPIRNEIDAIESSKGERRSKAAELLKVDGLDAKIGKLEAKILLRLEAEREEERIRNDIKLEQERKELRNEFQEERIRIMKEIQDKINIVKEKEKENRKLLKEKEEDKNKMIKEIKDENLIIIKQKEEEYKKEKEEERNRMLKEKEEERNRMIKEKEDERSIMMKEREEEKSLAIALIEATYQSRIQKLEIEREEERVKNRILEEERSRYIKLEAKLEEKEKIFEYERKEKEKKYESDRIDLLKLALSPSHNKFKKDKNKSEAKDENPSSASIVNISTLNSNNNNLADDCEDDDDKRESDADGGEDAVTENNVNMLSIMRVDWTKSISAASWLKFKCFLASLFLSLCTFLLMFPIVDKDFGLIHVVSTLSDSNHFFIAFVTMRFFVYCLCYFMISPSMYDPKNVVFFTYMAFCWLIVSMLFRFVFPMLTGKYIIANIEVSPPATAKVEMFMLLFITNIVSQVFGNVSLQFFFLYFKKDWMLDAMKEDEGKRNFKYIFFTKLKIEIVVNMAFWFMFSIIIGIVSIQYISNLDPNVEILLFGYLFPVIKASVAGICSWFSTWGAKKHGWLPEYSAKIASAVSGAAVQLCTLPQLYCVFRGANDQSFFLYQYIPHEIIKKLSWLTFHPLYLKTKMQILHLLNNVYESLCKKKDKVSPLLEGKTKDRRFTIMVSESLAAVAGDIFGRQFGEDTCMILITFYMLPIFQQYLFTQIYQSPSSPISFPSNQSIGIMIIGVAYSLETVLTIICFALLERVGIPINSNTQAIDFHSQTYLLYVFTFITWIIILTASTVY